MLLNTLYVSKKGTQFLFGCTKDNLCKNPVGFDRYIMAAEVAPATYNTKTGGLTMQITPETPIFLTQINCHPMLAFSFTLPPQDICWECITIFVEYGHTDAQADQIVYNVWAQFRDAVFRGFICSGCVPGKIEDTDTIQRIVCDINLSDTFHEQIYKFINCLEDAE